MIHLLEFFEVNSDVCCILDIGSRPFASFLHWDFMELNLEFVVTNWAIRHFKDICKGLTRPHSGSGTISVGWVQ
jgi:hypothetical protein